MGTKGQAPSPRPRVVLFPATSALNMLGLVSDLLTGSTYRRLMCSICAWEVLFHLSRACMRGAPRPRDPKASQALVDHGPSYMVSTIHATIVSLRGLRHVFKVCGVPSHPSSALSKCFLLLVA